MRKKILVTGGLGYIGSHTVVELQKSGYSVCIIDNLSNSDIRVLDWITEITGEEPQFEKVDCCDLSGLMKAFWKFSKLDGVIHFAASKAVGESVSNPLKYYDNNLNSLINVLKCMKEYKVTNLIFSSSCTVYGQPKVLPVTEESPIVPAESPYGNTKQISEEIIWDFVKSENTFKSICLRYFNPIGAHPSGLIGELPNGVPQNLVPYITQTAIGIRDILKIFGNDYNTKDGTCIRDYINVCDLAEAHVKAYELLCKQGNTHIFDVFNVGTGKGLTTLEIVEKFKEVNPVEVPYVFTERRPGDIEQIWANVDKSQSMLNWHARTSIEDTLKSAWEWQLHLRVLGIQ